MSVITIEAKDVLKKYDLLDAVNGLDGMLSIYEPIESWCMTIEKDDEHTARYFLNIGRFDGDVVFLYHRSLEEAKEEAESWLISQFLERLSDYLLWKLRNNHTDTEDAKKYVVSTIAKMARDIKKLKEKE